MHGLVGVDGSSRPHRYATGRQGAPGGTHSDNILKEKMLKQEQKDEIHALWDELADFGAVHAEAACRHLQGRLCQMTGAFNATWEGATRLGTQPECRGPFEGWRIPVTQLLHPVDSSRQSAGFKEIQGLWSRGVDAAPHLMLAMRNVGSFRAYGLRRDMPGEWFDGPFYRNHFACFGIMDSIWIGFPVSQHAESHFGFHSHATFGKRDVELLSYALRGIKWFHRQLMIIQGVLAARSSLTPTERKVLRLLLTSASEKEISEQLGLAVSTTHQHVVSLFRKFSVRSRAGLMSLWLGDPDHVGKI